MGKKDDLLSSVGSNVDESMGGGRTAPIPGVSTAGPAPKPARLQGVDRSKDAAEIEVDRIMPDPDQPREEFDPEGIARLADSMARHSQITPILVRWDESIGKFIIVAGERRWRAAVQAGLARLKCVIRDGAFEPGEILAIQVIENACREDLQPMEQAKAFRSLMETHGWSQHRLAGELGIAQPSVVRALSLLSLPTPVMVMVEQGELTRATAYEISKAPDEAAKIELAVRVRDEGLSRDQVADAVHEKRARSPKVGKGRGVVRPNTGPAKFREKGVRTPSGIKLLATRSKMFDMPELLTALEEAAGQIRAEIAAGQGGESEAA